MAKVINFLGGPGVGKSTYAAYIFVQMKVRGMKVGLIQEYAQELILDNRGHVLLEDQLEIFSEQNRRLKAAYNTYDYVLTDSPLILSSIYFNRAMPYDEVAFTNLVQTTFDWYDNINFVLIRNTDWEAFNAERKHTVSESILLDNDILEHMEKNNIKYRALENSIDVADIGAVLSKL